MSPNSVCSAVAITIPVAVPWVTRVPMKTIFLRSVTGSEWPGGGSGMTLNVFTTGSFSPCQRRFVNFEIDGLGLADKLERYYRYETDVGGDAVAYVQSD